MWHELATALPYCPKCGAQAFHPTAERLWVCATCDFHFYLNIATAVGGIIADEQGRILLIRRAQNPGKGMLGLPGGFLEIGETAELGLRREIREEVGLEMLDLRYHGSYANAYHYRELIYPTLDLFFICRPASTPFHCDPLEIAAAEWLLPAAIDLELIAFPSIRQAIIDYQQSII